MCVYVRMPRSTIVRDGLQNFPIGTRPCSDEVESEVMAYLTANMSWPKTKGDIYGRARPVFCLHQYHWKNTEKYELEGHTTQGNLFEEYRWEREVDGTRKVLRTKREKKQPWTRSEHEGQDNLCVRYLGEEVQWHRLASYMGGSPRVNCPPNMSWGTFQKMRPIKAGNERAVHLYHVDHGAQGHLVSTVDNMTIRLASEHYKMPRPRSRPY